MSDRICRVPKCSRTVKARGLCATCHRRVLRGGGEQLPQVSWPQDERIFANLDVADCWEWTACLNRDGYGVAFFNGKQAMAHRAVWQLLVGPIPEGMELDHLCYNRRCANPDHLEVVTPAVNSQRVRYRVGNGYDTRTHCRSGRHDIRDPAAICVRSDGVRVCVACQREVRERSKARRRVRQVTPA